MARHNGCSGNSVSSWVQCDGVRRALVHLRTGGDCDCSDCRTHNHPVSHGVNTGWTTGDDSDSTTCGALGSTSGAFGFTSGAFGFTMIATTTLSTRLSISAWWFQNARSRATRFAAITRTFLADNITLPWTFGRTVTWGTGQCKTNGITLGGAIITASISSGTWT